MGPSGVYSPSPTRCLFLFALIGKLNPEEEDGGGSDGFGEGTGTSEAWSDASISRRSSTYSHRNRYSGQGLTSFNILRYRIVSSSFLDRVSMVNRSTIVTLHGVYEEHFEMIDTQH